jgi:hypothetical protein
MPYALDRLVDYSRDALIAELKRVAKLVEDPVLSEKRFRAHARVSHMPYLRRFGSWGQALAEAGLKHRYGGPSVTYKLRRRAGGRLSDDELLALLRRVARPDGTVSALDVERLSPVSWTTYRRRFGSWPEAVRRAGLRQSKMARVYDERECFENLRTLWTHYGRAPVLEETKRPPSTVGPAAYQRRFRSWNRALAAFVEWANAQETRAATRAKKAKDGAHNAGPPSPGARGLGGGATSDAGGGAESAEPRKAPAPRWAPEDRRHIPMGLRFKVLERDHYRCTACGDSPAITRGCKLHLDHIVPWSQGGSSVPENLRTLCAACNFGKGARHPNPLPPERQSKGGAGGEPNGRTGWRKHAAPPLPSSVIILSPSKDEPPS